MVENPHYQPFARFIKRELKVVPLAKHHTAPEDESNTAIPTLDDFLEPLKRSGVLFSYQIKLTNFYKKIESLQISRFNQKSTHGKQLTEIVEKKQEACDLLQSIMKLPDNPSSLFQARQQLITFVVTKIQYFEQEAAWQKPVLTSDKIEQFIENLSSLAALPKNRQAPENFTNTLSFSEEKFYQQLKKLPTKVQAEIQDIYNQLLNLGVDAGTTLQEIEASMKLSFSLLAELKKFPTQCDFNCYFDVIETVEMLTAFSQWKSRYLLTEKKWLKERNSNNNK